MVPNTPDFSGKAKDENLVIETSFHVGTAILSSNVKNYNLALSAAMVAKDPDSVTAVLNFAAAIAYYFDDSSIFKSFEAFRDQANNKYYKDAEKAYYYAIELSKEDGKFTACRTWSWSDNG